MPHRSQCIGWPTATILTVISALLVVLAFPPYSLRALIWVALVPLLLALRAVPPRQALVLAGLWGMIGAYGTTDWLPRTVASYYLQPVWLGMILFLTAAFLMGGVYYAAFGAFYSWAVRRRLRPMAVLAAAAWVAAEFGRARVLTGNPWGLLGYTLPGGIDQASLLRATPLAVLQVASLAGVYGLTFLIVATNAALAEVAAVLAARRDHERPAAGVTEVAVAAALLLAAVAYGRARLAGDVPSAPPIPVAVVQGNLDLGSQWNESLYGRNLSEYLDETRKAVAEAPTRIVFWPENAMTFFVANEPAYRAAIAIVTEPADVELVTGGPRVEDPDSPRYFNSAFVLAPSGRITAVYDKEHLLPFTEYFPFGAIAYLRRQFGRVREFTPGSATAPLPTRAGLAGIVICNEAMFPRIAGRRVREGAEYLVNLSNDTWVPDAEFALHQFQIVSLRAVESGRYMVRASTSGPSAIIDPFGRSQARSVPFTRSWLQGTIRPLRTKTPYARLGDAFAWACVVVVALALAVGRRRGLTGAIGVEASQSGPQAGSP